MTIWLCNENIVIYLIYVLFQSGSQIFQYPGKIAYIRGRMVMASHILILNMFGPVCMETITPNEWQGKPPTSDDNEDTIDNDDFLSAVLWWFLESL